MLSRPNHAVRQERATHLTSITAVANRSLQLLFPKEISRFDSDQWSQKWIKQEIYWTTSASINRLLLAHRYLEEALRCGELIAFLSSDLDVSTVATRDQSLAAGRKELPKIFPYLLADRTKQAEDEGADEEDVQEEVTYSVPYIAPSVVGQRPAPDRCLLKVDAAAWQDSNTQLDVRLGTASISKTYLSWNAVRTDFGAVSRRFDDDRSKTLGGDLLIANADRYFVCLGREASALPECLSERYSAYRRDWTPELIAAGWRHLALNPADGAEALSKALMMYRDAQLPEVAPGRSGVTKGSLFPPNDKSLGILARNIIKQFREKDVRASVLVPSSR